MRDDGLVSGLGGKSKGATVRHGPQCPILEEHCCLQR